MLANLAFLYLSVLIFWYFEERIFHLFLFYCVILKYPIRLPLLCLLIVFKTYSPCGIPFMFTWLSFILLVYNGVPCSVSIATNDDVYCMSCDSRILLSFVLSHNKGAFEV